MPIHKDKKDPRLLIENLKNMPIRMLSQTFIDANGDVYHGESDSALFKTSITLNFENKGKPTPVVYTRTEVPLFGIILEHFCKELVDRKINI